MFSNRLIQILDDSDIAKVKKYKKYRVGMYIPYNIKGFTIMQKLNHPYEISSLSNLLTLNTR